MDDNTLEWEDLKDILELVDEGVIYQKADGKIKYCNQEAQRLFGFCSDEVDSPASANHECQLVYEDGSPCPGDEHPSMITLRSGQALSSQIRGMARPGEPIAWLSFNTNPIFRHGMDLPAAVVISFRDITQEKLAEREQQANLKLLESMDLINRAIQGTNDLDQMMRDVLDQVLAIFDCDRAWLVYPCDPEAPSWRVPMERTKPEYPGAAALGCEMPMNDEIADKLKEMLAAGRPVQLGSPSSRPLPPETAERFGFKSLIGMAIFPKVGKPWEFGLHQCSYARVWTPEEERLFQTVGRRLSDALSVLLVHNELRQNEEKLSKIFQAAPLGIALTSVEDGRLLDINEALARQLGLTREEALSRTSYDVGIWRDPEQRRKFVETIKRKGGLRNLENVVRARDGQDRYYLWSSEPIELNGQECLINVTVDITKRKQAEAALYRLNRELQAISSCNQAMIRAFDEKALLEDICRIFCEEAGYHMAWVGYAEDDKAKRVRPMAWAGHEDGYLTSANITWDDTEHGQGPAGKAIREGKIVCVQDFATDSQTRPWRERALKRKYRSNLTLPLKDDNGKTFGILAIYSTEINAFTPDERRLLKEMSEDMAFGIVALRTREARILAEEELRRSHEKKTLLNQIANIFLTVPDKEMYAEVLAVILQVMESEFGVFGYLDEKGDLVIPSLTRDVWEKCQVPEKSVVFPASAWGESLWGKAIRRKSAFYADAPFKTPEGHIAMNNLLTVPMVFGERTIGLVSVANKQEGYTEQDKDLLLEIANNISPILNARLQRDTHERKRLEAVQALRESGERITALFNATTDSVVLLDPQASVLAINEQGAQRRGMRIEELEGKSINEILPQALALTREEKIREVVSRAQPAVFEEEWEGKSYAVRMFPVLDDNGDVRQIACFSRDVTEIKRAEEEKAKLEEQLRQAQKMEAIGTLAGGIAHDFNNILGAIMGYSEIALDDAEQGNLVPNDLKQVIKAAERGKDLVRQILTFSRKVEHDLKPLDLNRVVKQAANLLEKTIPKMIKLEMDMADDLQPINADANQMEQVILNLGVNAADAMPEGGELRITSKNLWMENQTCMTCGKLLFGQYVALTVSDSGHGMDQHTLEHLFEPFYTTKEIGKGTGLGLSTVYGIVLAHNGHITCQSTPGAGTTFTLYFSSIGGKGGASPAADAFAPQIPGGHEKILLVDDEEAIREVGKRMLQKVGYNVLTTSSGELAVEAYLSKGKDFDLVIMDLNMPGMGGYKAMKAILEINPQAKVLVASGYAANELKKDVLNFGAVDFVAKPFQRSAFLAAVRNLLDQS